jgi:quercetin dioxygenase-like cupin family protein
MKQKFNNQFILAMSISLSLLACNQNDKTNTETKATDSTSAAKTEPAPAAPQASAIDAIQAAPNLYKLVKDTLGLRIVEATYKPGDSSALHSHPDYALYVIEGGTAEFTTKDGAKIANEMKTGMSNIRPAEFHSVKNIGKTTVKALLVEVNRPAGTTSPDAATDATKVAAGLYKIKKDTLGIRVLEATYKPGQSSAMHSHPDAVLYVINGGTSEFTEKDGTKRSNELKAGTAMVTPASTHTVKNIGKTTAKVVLVEVYRSMK